jgi:hypothetical protein
MALNVTVQSYNGRLDYGLIACRRAMPDVNELADFMLAEHRTLLEIALATVPAPVQITAASPKAALAKKTARKKAVLPKELPWHDQTTTHWVSP